MYYYFVHPRILNALKWLSQNLAFSFFIGLFFGVFIVDLVYSDHILSKIKKFANTNGVIIKYEELKNHIIESREKGYEKVKFIFAMNSKMPIIDYLNKYYENKISKDNKHINNDKKS